jgi:hypothetical protein
MRGHVPLIFAFTKTSFQDKLVKGRWLHIVACYQAGDQTNPMAGVQIYKDGHFRLAPPSPGTL